MAREMPHKTSMFEDEYKYMCMLHMKSPLSLETEPLNLSVS